MGVWECVGMFVCVCVSEGVVDVCRTECVVDVCGTVCDGCVGE